MSKPAAPAIVPQKNEFDDNFLNVVGTQFKFDHAKGISEWIKNSADAYARESGVPDAAQHIVLRFRIGNPKRNSIFECIDFVGMTKSQIDRAVKVWGLKTAAKGGKDIVTYGGHGNGGKFYMRQMFQQAVFITYRSGKLNVFGFDKNKRYGYAKDKKDVVTDLKSALKFAGIDHLEIPEVVSRRWAKKKSAAGFTVVRGEYPERFSGKATLDSLIQRLTIHPQARRLLTRKHVSVLQGIDKSGVRIAPPSIAAKTGFEKPREIQLPSALTVNGTEIKLGTRAHPPGKLILKTSEEALARSSELSELNGIEILGEISCVGSYKMHELGVINPHAEFIYGECQAAFLEDDEFESVSNDREKLVKNEVTDALLGWIREQISALATEMGNIEQATRQERNLQESALFNKMLDKWKNIFMHRLTAELFGGGGYGSSTGGEGTGGGGLEEPGIPFVTDPMPNPENPGLPPPPVPAPASDDPVEGPGSDKGPEGGGEDGGKGGGSGTKRQSGSRFPRVLLSSYDPDPLSEVSAKLDLAARQPPVYQRDQDVVAGIYWINTSRPLATRIMNQYTVTSTRWREYLFQRYVEIIIKQQILELGRRDAEITVDKVDVLIDAITMKIHDAAAVDLEAFLFNEDMTGKAATSSGAAQTTNSGGTNGTQQQPAGDEPVALGNMLASGTI